MMAAKRIEPRLLDRLPTVRGRYSEDAALHRITWFRVGGPAEVLFRPLDKDDLAAFLAALPADVPVMALGVGSNLLVRDGGVAGVVIRLGRGFATLETAGEWVIAGAMALDLSTAKTAARAGIAGLEFLSGVPGTIGGALRMNAGAFGSDMASVLIEATAIDRDGREHCLGRDDMGFAYRSSAVPEDWIFTAATLQGAPGDEPEIAARMADIAQLREASQPLRSRTGGSTFKNPEGASAWELIEAAGCRGLTRGGAMVSDKHCNFLINTGSASAADIEGLGEEVRRRVSETCGVTLEWEIKRVGRHPANAVGGAP
jgi:UDP-N-acetylmuramate dehydrogenase